MPRKPEKCIALDVNGHLCRRASVRVENYHGDGELYGYFHEPWAGWVRAPLCDKHSEPRRVPRKPRASMKD